MKRFNVTTTCIPFDHYMVDISNKLENIEKLIDMGTYFTINRARQYGKTTTLSMLYKRLQDKYLIIRGSLEGFGSEVYNFEKNFANSFLDMITKRIKFQDKELASFILNIKELNGIESLSDAITDICIESKKEIILMIDEVDKASSNVIFLDFLAMLRDKYNNMKDSIDKTFKSVILAGVHDIKNLKIHIKERRLLSEEESRLIDKTTYNSPWNVAEDFLIDMSFSVEEINTMLIEYEADYKIGINISDISKIIYDYTSGYPYLVSKICKVIDERLDKNWGIDGVKKAVKTILGERGTLFDDLIKNIEHDQNLYNTVYSLVVEGEEIAYNIYAYEKGIMYGILKKNNEGFLAIDNKIFEILLYEYMTAMKEMKKVKKTTNYETRNQFIDSNGDINMEMLLCKFQEFMKEEYRYETEKFVEKECRLIFLSFIKPVINGSGFYYVETETRTNKRFDIVISYNKKEYIIELKKYYDKPREEKGYKQLAEYMEIKKASLSYMVVFDFRKSKDYTSEWLDIDGKKIYEVVV